MKIRSGFITNSSSSSFVIIGKEVKLEDIDLSNGDYVGFGKSLCEGEDVFSVTEYMIRILPYLDYDFDFCLAKEKFYEPLGSEVLINGDCQIWAVREDHHSSCDENIFEHYNIDRSALMDALKSEKITIDEFEEIIN